jgi:hypothetical protein
MPIARLRGQVTTDANIRAMILSCPRALALSAGMAIFATGATASANGRYPKSNQLLIDPNDPAHLVTRATFGLLNSTDAGQSWEWVCEQAIGYMGTEDPAIAVTADGSTVAVSTRGLTVTHDGGCSWTRHSDRLGIDVTVDRGNPHRALVAERFIVGSALTTFLLETTDDGATFTDLGATFEPRFLLETVDIAPSNPARVYVSGTFSDTQLGAVARSDDGGRTFMSFMLNLPVGDTPFIGAIDAKDADTLYVRTRSLPGVGLPYARVLVSRDGAATWQELWMTPGEVPGLSLSPDGQKIAAGGQNSGVLVAGLPDGAFQRASNTPVSCLTWAAAGIYACGEETSNRFSLGLSDDEGVTFQPLLHFRDVHPRSCDSGEAPQICSQYWGALAPLLGIDAGAIGGTVDGGTDTTSPDAPSRRGCSCRVGAHRTGRAWAIATSLLLACFLSRYFFDNARRRFR